MNDDHQKYKNSFNIHIYNQKLIENVAHTTIDLIGWTDKLTGKQRFILSK